MSITTGGLLSGGTRGVGIRNVARYQLKEESAIFTYALD